MLKKSSKNLKTRHRIILTIISILIVISISILGKSFVGNPILKNPIYNYDNILCKRATKLHTNECKYNNSKYCESTGNDLITFGQVGNSNLIPGDAYDCDVNGDGIYDSNNERFYYISDYYDTKNQDFDDEYAVLVYYKNISDNIAWYKTSDTSKGPKTAVSKLTKRSDWNNTSLKTIKRNVSNKDFSYRGHTSRLLTYNELNNGCLEIYKTSTGEHKRVKDSCDFLVEQTSYTNKSSLIGFWLENSNNSNAYVLATPSTTTLVFEVKPDTDGTYGVRPVIDVKKTRIEGYKKEEVVTSIELDDENKVAIIDKNTIPTVASVINLISGAENIVVTDALNNTMGIGDSLKTTDKLFIDNNEYSIAVKGDYTGDGESDMNDIIDFYNYVYNTIQGNISETIKPCVAQLKAINIDINKKVDLYDVYELYKNYNDLGGN